MMKRITSQLKYVLFLFALVLSVSCSTEDGMDGEQGPQGEQGPVGADGRDGNANVISVVIEDVNIVAGPNAISVPELTAAIANNGFVQAYVASSETEWTVFPVSFVEEVSTPTGTTFSSIIVLETTSIAPGVVNIFSSLQDQPLTLRFVLVEGTPSTTPTL
jgi:hypothetical protein